jgi:exodeoxyribonuclease VII large subunit
VLPERSQVLRALSPERNHLNRSLALRIASARQRLTTRQDQLRRLHPSRLLVLRRQWLERQRQLLQALSPAHILARGFSLLRGGDGRLLRSVTQLRPGNEVFAELADGRVAMRVQGGSEPNVAPAADPPNDSAEPAG